MGLLRLRAIERWWLRIGVFLLPLAFAWDTYDQYVLPKLLLARVLVLGLLILLVVRSILNGALTIRRTPLDVPLLVFLASAAVSTVFALNQNVAVFGTYSRYDGLLTIVTYAGLFWLSVQVIRDRDDARSLLRVLLASGYVVSAIAILQSVGDSLSHQTLMPAFGTLGQKNLLGMFLAMLCPIAFREVIDADAWSKRIVAINALLVIGAGLLLSQSHSAWIGLMIAAAIVLFGSYRPRPHPALPHRGRERVSLWVALAGGTLIVVALVIAGVTITSRQQTERRPDIWRDSLALIASRPVVGYGPDNFGLVYPRFQTKELGTQQVDKAHSEVLQVAATQGLIGLAAYGLVLVVFVRAFWRGRERPGAVAVFAGLAAYQVALQLNFTALAAALPFWVVAAVATETWDARWTANIALDHRRLSALAGAFAGAALLTLAFVAVVRPYVADSRLRAAVQADVEGRHGVAETAAAEARQLAPQESVYAVEVGNIAFERGDWSKAADAYVDAAALGTYNPLVYRNLALADRNLGRFTEARAAARKAFELDRYDPANRALLAQLEALVRNQTLQRSDL